MCNSSPPCGFLGDFADLTWAPKSLLSHLQGAQGCASWDRGSLSRATQPALGLWAGIYHAAPCYAFAEVPKARTSPQPSPVAMWLQGGLHSWWGEQGGLAPPAPHTCQGWGWGKAILCLSFCVCACSMAPRPLRMCQECSNMPALLLSRESDTALRRKHLWISQLQALSSVILEPKKIKSATLSSFSPSICQNVIPLSPGFLICKMDRTLPTIQSRGKNSTQFLSQLPSGELRGNYPQTRFCPQRLSSLRKIQYVHLISKTLSSSI